MGLPAPPSSRSEPATRESDRFRAERMEAWRRLDGLVRRFEVGGPRALSMEDMRALGQLYRASCADLLVARTELRDAALCDYLDGLVAKAYAIVYAPEPVVVRSTLLRFWGETFPALVRREVRFVALAGVLLLLGGAFGAFVMLTDPEALSVVIPDMHLSHTPRERVHLEGFAGHDAGRSAVFSSYLFTHNIQVTFLVFALGITLGIGTAFVLFWNGIPLGALAAQYHTSGEGLFFWAWILPHGVIEITAVLIAGASGFVLARGLWFPARETRGAALVREGRSAVALVLGGIPMLVVAGLVEGTISQMHAPRIPYGVKLGFAAALFFATLTYLRRGFPSRRGRASPSPTDVLRASAGD